MQSQLLQNPRAFLNDCLILNIDSLRNQLSCIQLSIFIIDIGTGEANLDDAFQQNMISSLSFPTSSKTVPSKSIMDMNLQDTLCKMGHRKRAWTSSPSRSPPAQRHTMTKIKNSRTDERN